jgi:hypothetical protein
VRVRVKEERVTRAAGRSGILCAAWLWLIGQTAIVGAGSVPVVKGSWPGYARGPAEAAAA